MPRTDAEKKIWARKMVVDALKNMDKKPRPGSVILMVKVGNQDEDEEEMNQENEERSSNGSDSIKREMAEEINC